MRAKRNVYKILVGRPKGKRTLRKPRRTLEDNVKIDLVRKWAGMKWIHLAQDGFR
jgi:hypothetical protein